MVGYIPRFVTEKQLMELVNLFHLAKCALSGKSCTRYDRMVWASGVFHKDNPTISSTAAYKDLDSALK